MNTQPRNKILIIIIGILLIANIVTLSFLLMNKNDGRSGRQDKRTQLAAFLKNEVGFTESQLTSYDSISKIHKANMKSGFDEIATGREGIFKQVASQSFSDSAIELAANSIIGQQKAFEIKMLHNLKEIRNLCTPAQQQVFDTGFYKIISKRGDRKDNRKQ